MVLRRAGQVFACLLLLLLLVAGWVAWRLHASLPRLDGTLEISGLAAPVTVERDALGIPTLVAANLDDAVRAQGFVHAQDRFFQMDLTRRAAAGELAALFGARAVDADKKLRAAQRRHAAAGLLASSSDAVRRRVEIYTEGVNAGLAALGAPPPEYVLLRARPQPWRPEDTYLALLSFYDVLSFNHRMERPLGVMAATLPAALFDFLTPSTSRWDAPLVETDDGGYQPAPVPGPEVLDLRGAAPVSIERDIVRPTGLALGSNNWAVSGAHTDDGRSILANDPHLGLRVPHVWHRIRLDVAGRQVSGVGAPGLPGVVIGSNGDLAWGATNSFADQTDLVVVEVDPDDPTRYRTPEGWEPFDAHDETIEVHGGAPQALTVRWTRWGPVEDEDWLGRPLVVRSTVHEPGGLDFALFDLWQATTIEEAVAIIDRWRGPSQNWLLADAGGRIAWVVNGPIPRRQGFDGKVPVSWAGGDVSWVGERAGPRLIDPPSGLLYTANGRTVPQDPDPLTHVWMHSGRVNRISARLARETVWDEAELRAIQLDVRSAYNDFAVDVIAEAVPADDPDPTLRRMRELAQSWDGTAGLDEAGFVVVAEVTDALLDGVLEPLLAPAAAADERFVFDWALADEPVRRLLEERPQHLVPPPYATWPEFLRAVVESVASDLASRPGGVERTWAETRTVEIRHPLGGLPLIGREFNMPPTPLPGWAGTVRAQTKRYGASMRMVVSPGREERGLLHMPTGESGHFLSPHYADQQEAWVEGLPTPFLPGAPVDTLTLLPR
jgi:penicillin G amidase